MSTPYITSTVYVSPALPATFDKAGYEALTWTKVAHPISVPIPGIETAMIDVPNLETGFTKASKGSSTGRVSTMAHANVPADTGQANLRTYAAETYVDEISVKVLYPASSNKVAYMSGLASNYLENEGTAETHQGFTASFRQNYAAVITTPP
jgi:hypothetical protein